MGLISEQHRYNLLQRLPELEVIPAAQELGEKQSDVALAWLLQREGVTAPIMGIRTLEQLESAVHALDIHLEADFLAELDKIFPGYGSAPEYYAW